MPSGCYARDWEVTFRVTSDRPSRRLFGSEKTARAFADDVRGVGGRAAVTGLAPARARNQASTTERTTSDD